MWPQDGEAPAPRIQTICHPDFERAGVKPKLLRLDEVGWHDGGNKRYKLEPVLRSALESGRKGIVSFSGPASNHLVSLASLCRQARLECIAYVRDDPLRPSPFTSYASRQGAKIQFTDPGTWRQYRTSDSLAEMAARYPEHQILREAGNTPAGLKNLAAVLLQYIPGSSTWAAVPVGTGGTLAALSLALRNVPTQALGFAAWRGQSVLEADVRALAAECGHYRPEFRLDCDYHGGGFGKCDEQTTRAAAWLRSAGVPADLRFTAKMGAGLEGSLRTGRFHRGDAVVGVVTALPVGTQLEVGL